MQIDASVSTNFKDIYCVLYGGVDFRRYDANYKEVRMNLDNGRKIKIREESGEEKSKRKDGII
jgi:hypothetical protein